MQLYARCKDGVPYSYVGGILGWKEFAWNCEGWRVSDVGSRPTLVICDVALVSCEQQARLLALL